MQGSRVYNHEVGSSLCKRGMMQTKLGNRMTLEKAMMAIVKVAKESYTGESGWREGGRLSRLGIQNIRNGS